MTRLSILHTESSIGWGGQEIRILTEMAGMQARGHRVHLLTPDCAHIYVAAQKRGIPVTAIPMVKKRLPALWRLRRWLAQHASEFDIVNTHSSTDSWLTTLAAQTLRNVPPIIRTRHVSTPVSPDAASRWLYGQAAHIVTTGEALRQQLHRDNGFALARMTSIPTGIDLERFQPLDTGAMRRALGLIDAPTLGIVATLRSWKGHEYLLDACAQLRDRYPSWRLLIIGDGPQRTRLEMRTAELALDKSVSFVGNVNNVNEWLGALDLFVLPSYGDEGVPQSIMQAMACGLPVVSTPIGGIAEAVVHNETGLLIPPRDVTALAGALSDLMSDPHRREDMGRAGIARARQRFGLDDMLDAMERVFLTHARAPVPDPVRHG